MTVADILTTLRMGSVNLVVIVESTRSLITKEGDELQAFHLPSIIAVGSALGEDHDTRMRITPTD